MHEAIIKLSMNKSNMQITHGKNKLENVMINREKQKQKPKPVD